MSTLPELARELGFAVKKQGRSWGGRKCPSCGSGEAGSNRLNIYIGMDGKWRFKCHACSCRGDAIDFLAMAKGVSLREAMKEIKKAVGVDSEQIASESDDAQRHAAVKQVIAKLVEAGHGGRSEVGAYLGRRGISMRTLDIAIGRGIVRCLPDQPYLARRFLTEVVGDGLLLQAGFLKDGKKWPAIAFRPLVGILPGHSGAEFRLGREATPNEVKSILYGKITWPWWWRVSHDVPVSRVIVVEGLIDMLSVVEMGLVASGDAVMGLPGASSWRDAWFTQIAGRYPGVRFEIATDADDAGDKAAESMLQALDAADLPGKRLRPPAKDWNEVLVRKGKGVW